MFYPSHVLFFKVLFSNFPKKNFVQFFCYSFTVSQTQLFSPILQFQTCKLLHHFLTVCSSVTRSKFQVSSFVFLQKKLFLYSSFTFSLTSFIGSHVQFIYIGILQCFIRHTCYSLRFSLVILQKTFFVQFCYSFTVSQIQLFSPILYFQTCNSFISLFYYNVYPSHGQFLRFLLCIFHRNKSSLMRTPT